MSLNHTNEGSVNINNVFCWREVGVVHQALFKTTQGAAKYSTRATLGTPSNFQWQTEAPRFTHQFCYDLYTMYVDLDLYKNTYGCWGAKSVETLRGHTVCKRLNIRVKN